MTILRYSDDRVWEFSGVCPISGFWLKFYSVQKYQKFHFFQKNCYKNTSRVYTLVPGVAIKQHFINSLVIYPAWACVIGTTFLHQELVSTKFINSSCSFLMHREKGKKPFAFFSCLLEGKYRG